LFFLILPTKNYKRVIDFSEASIRNIVS